MALVEDSCEDRKASSAEASVLAHSSEFDSSASPSRRVSWSCGVLSGSPPWEARKCCWQTSPTTLTEVVVAAAAVVVVAAYCWNPLVSFSLECCCAASRE